MGQNLPTALIPMESDIFPESIHTMQAAVTYIAVQEHRERKHFKCDQLYTLFFLPNHHKWTNATSLCKQDILSLNHSKYRGILKLQLNREVRTFI